MLIQANVLLHCIFTIRSTRERVLMEVFLSILTYMSAAGLLFVGVAYLYGRFFQTKQKNLVMLSKALVLGPLETKKTLQF